MRVIVAAVVVAAAVAAALLAAAVPAQDVVRLKTGRWRATLASPGGELPFGLRIGREAGRDVATLLNGAEELRVAAVEVVGRTVTFAFAPYESAITAEIEDDGARLRGTWRARRDADRWTEIAFEAVHGDAPRFPMRARLEIPALPPRFAVDFSSDDQPAVLVATAGADGVARATFLTTLGDYRFLAGAWDGSLLQLSCFDGAHAFLFRATQLPDGTLGGDFWSKDSWHETWTARPDPDAVLPDGFGLTAAAADCALGSLSFPDLDGQERNLGDPAFAGRARILFVFGTWCPNCRDATRLMVDLDARFRDRGLSIVGLAFERTGDPAVDLPQLKRYVASQHVRYPVLLAGPADKAKAGAAFPLLDAVVAYPTTIFLDAEGAVRAVYTGFSGPATGDDHARLITRFEALVRDLLK